MLTHFTLVLRTGPLWGLIGSPFSVSPARTPLSTQYSLSEVPGVVQGLPGCVPASRPLPTGSTRAESPPRAPCCPLDRNQTPGGL